MQKQRLKNEIMSSFQNVASLCNAWFNQFAQPLKVNNSQQPRFGAYENEYYVNGGGGQYQSSPYPGEQSYHQYNYDQGQYHQYPRGYQHQPYGHQSQYQVNGAYMANGMEANNQYGQEELQFTSFQPERNGRIEHFSQKKVPKPTAHTTAKLMKSKMNQKIHEKQPKKKTKQGKQKNGTLKQRLLNDPRMSEKPKFPLTAYFQFMVQVKNSQRVPIKSSKDFSVKAGEMWRELDDEKKQIYVERAIVDKQRYLRQVQNFYQKYPDLMPRGYKSSFVEPKLSQLTNMSTEYHHKKNVQVRKNGYNRSFEGSEQGLGNGHTQYSCVVIDQDQNNINECDDNAHIVSQNFEEGTQSELYHEQSQQAMDTPSFTATGSGVKGDSRVDQQKDGIQQSMLLCSDQEDQLKNSFEQQQQEENDSQQYQEYSIGNDHKQNHINSSNNNDGNDQRYYQQEKEKESQEKVEQSHLKLNFEQSRARVQRQNQNMNNDNLSKPNPNHNSDLNYLNSSNNSNVNLSDHSINTSSSSSNKRRQNIQRNKLWEQMGQELQNVTASQEPQRQDSLEI